MDRIERIAEMRVYCAAVALPIWNALESVVALPFAEVNNMTGYYSRVGGGPSSSPP